jgi:hypothetical protein
MPSLMSPSRLRFLLAAFKKEIRLIFLTMPHQLEPPFDPAANAAPQNA